MRMEKQDGKIASALRRKRMTNKIPQGLPLEVLIAVAHSDPKAMPNASKPMAQKDKLKNVTPIDPWCNDGREEPDDC